MGPVGPRGWYSPYLKLAFVWAEHDPFRMTEDHRATTTTASITASWRDGAIYLSDGAAGKLKRDDQCRDQRLGPDEVFAGDATTSRG